MSYDSVIWGSVLWDLASLLHQGTRKARSQESYATRSSPWDARKSEHPCNRSRTLKRAHRATGRRPVKNVSASGYATIYNIIVNLSILSSFPIFVQPISFVSRVWSHQQTGIPCQLEEDYRSYLDHVPS